MEPYQEIIIEMVKQLQNQEDLHRIYNLVSYLYIRSQPNLIPSPSNKLNNDV